MASALKSIFELELMIVIQTQLELKPGIARKADDVDRIFARVYLRYGCSFVAKRRRKWILMCDYHSFYNTLVCSFVPFSTYLCGFSFQLSASAEEKKKETNAQTASRAVSHTDLHVHNTKFASHSPHFFCRPPKPQTEAYVCSKQNIRHTAKTKLSRFCLFWLKNLYKYKPSLNCIINVWH